MPRPNLKQSFALLITALCLIFAARLQAQEPDKTGAEAGKPTKFWNSKDSDQSPRWDLSEEPGVFLYVEQLRHKRPNDKIVYIAYGPFGEVAWYLLSVRNWLNNSGGTAEDLIYTFDGGREKELRYEAWLIPEGAELPKVAGPPAEDEKAVIDFSAVPYDGVCELCGVKGRFVLAALAKALRERPQRKAYLEFYGCAGSLRHRASVANREAKMVKQILIKEGGVAPSRILVKTKVSGKQRCEARIWLLPPHLNSIRK